MPEFKNYSEKSELEDNDISILSELNGNFCKSLMRFYFRIYLTDCNTPKCFLYMLLQLSSHSLKNIFCNFFFIFAKSSLLL